MTIDNRFITLRLVHETTAIPAAKQLNLLKLLYFV